MTLLQPCKVFHLRRGSKDFDLRRGRDKSREKEKYRGRFFPEEKKTSCKHSDMWIVEERIQKQRRQRQLWKTEGTQKRETGEQKTIREGSTLVIIKEQPAAQ